MSHLPLPSNCPKDDEMRTCMSGIYLISLAPLTLSAQIFCFPCILHYLSTSENKWARCPICFDSVNARQLKSVKWYDGPTPIADAEDALSALSLSSTSTPRLGNLLRMRLIQRPQITTLALPRSETWPSDLLPPHQAPFHFLPDVLNFAKFMLATPRYLIEELTRERDQLAQERRLFESMNDPLGLYFVNAADEHVQHQIMKATALETPLLNMQIEKAQRDQHDLLAQSALTARRTQQQVEQSTKADPQIEVPNELLSSRSLAPTIPADAASSSHFRNNPRQRRNINPPPPSTSTYYYYQAASGLPIFLHPLDIRILVAHFNGYASFPDSILVRVEGTSESTVNDDLRKRCKYLSHLPEGTDVIFIEADLEGVVGVEGLKNFEGPLKTRANKRKEKARKDDRAKARAEERMKEEEMRALARFTHTPVFPRPEISPADFVSLSNSSDNGGGSSSERGVSPSSSPPTQSGAWGQRSFASALHSASPARSGSGASTRRLTAEQEWEAEQVWQDLEQQTLVGGGRKKKGSRMVILGGSGAPALRRR